MTVDQMRIELYKTYPGMNWKLKVRDMSEAQVLAVYRNLKSKGIIK